MTRLLPTVALAVTLALAPSPSSAQGTAAPARSTPVPNAAQTRAELNALLRQYPPSLVSVLRLDPSLLDNQAYMAPFPQLTAFLAQHPEVARDPAYFIGRMGVVEFATPAVRVWNDLTEMATLVFVFLGIGGTLVWLIRSVIDQRRWSRLVKIQTEAHAKVFDRLSSSDDLLTYIQSPAGRRFLEATPISAEAGPRPLAAPVGRILWSVQAGIVALVLGIGLWFIRRTVPDEVAQPILAVGILAISLGLGFVISAGVAYLVSQRLGLFEPPPVSPHA
jgi:hypothetical protein